MLKYFIKLTTLVALVAFVGCAKEQKNTTPTESTNDVNTPADEELAKKEEAAKKAEEAAKKAEEVKVASVDALKKLGKNTLASLKGEEKTKAENALIAYLSSLDVKAMTEKAMLAKPILDANSHTWSAGDSLGAKQCADFRTKVANNIKLITLTSGAGLGDKDNKNMFLKKMRKLKPNALVSGIAKRSARNDAFAALPCNVSKKQRKDLGAKKEFILSEDEQAACAVFDNFVNKVIIDKFNKAMK